MRHRGPRAPARDRASAPEERSLTGPQYVGSFPRADAPLDPPLPEVAFIGRSNVGKSSLLNALLGRRIARVSATPGKTRMLNVFLIPDWSTEQGAGSKLLRAPCSLYFLDLPGYGYARAGKADRAAFGRLVRYALARERLAGVVWLLDLRREPSAEDRTMQELLVERETHVLAALTKGDKLPRSQRQRRAEELRAALALPEDQIILTSARTGDGVPELRDAIEALALSGG
jgi:GTP-binding protein